VLTTPKLKAPLSKQYLKAKIVSAVSPDCDTKMATSSLKTGVFRSRKSDAMSSEIEGISHAVIVIGIFHRLLTQLNGNRDLSELFENGSDLS